MKLIVEKKAQTVETMIAELKKAKSFALFNFASLSAKEITTFRRKLHNGNAKMFIAKNNIYNRALQLSNYQVEKCSNSTALIIGYEDEIVPFKELSEVIKNNQKAQFIFGFLDGQKIDNNKFKVISSLPGRDGLYSMFLSCLQAPLRNFLYGIKAVGERK
ncbi:MAG: 50S ribosomal protein L10 [Mycoplasmataceae bacterium]|jgi:large subunit ribosomal protein L10|nr:50S ribosomal protein L10 [Mycoplasmataceae bacterium]